MNTAPVFVKIDEYKDVIDVLHLIRTRIAEAKKTLAQINELKNREDHELSAWHAEVTEIEKRIDFVDKLLFPPEDL
ncbi:hypothetical protein HY491_01030 [Candidatus Woesearchaeota archaeon]|nr:hypothetical protein [Candidatus Woesearchaeota archaeon]